MSSQPLVLFDGDTVGRRRTGDENYTVNLLRELPAGAPELSFACSLRDPGNLPADVPETVRRLQLDVPSPYRRIPFAFPALARRESAALAHLHYFAPPRLPCPAVVTVHDISFARAPELFSRRDRMLFRFVRGSLRRAARVIAVSEFTRSEVCERYGLEPGKVVAIPNGVSPRYRPLPDASERVHRRFGIDRPYVLCVGALQARKNVPLAIEAYSLLTGRGTDCELVVAGGDKGGRLDVLDAILRTRLTGRVHLVGHVEDEELPALYSGARALLFPSLYEGFGIPALEAMAAGTPVIASNTTGLAETVGDAGITVDPRSAEDVSQALGRLLDDDALRERLVAAGQVRAAEFTWARAAAATAEVYREALA
ncbi:MAG TPA: glycosyltransferase family 1 protein [Gaiellales bacterium]|jgi:glycosyltransferase involved in cell wall biosynthesis|nr:glycosyltransferase family 1 protein [Gaiellales bacterium]